MAEERDTYTVIQWATGSIGQIAIRHFVDNPVFELVGVYVTSDAKHGLDAGEVAGIGPVGVTCTTDRNAVLALDADCVSYAPLYYDVEEMSAILRSGKNLVTPSGFAYPPRATRRRRRASRPRAGRVARRCTAPASTRASSATSSHSRVRGS